MHDKGRRQSKKVLLGVFCLVIAILLGFVVFFSVSAGRKGVTVRQDGIVPVEQGDMTAVFAAPATVASGNQGIFDILEGTMVNEVNVRVGDLVKKGDMLATFETEGLDEILEKKRKDFDSAKKSYAEYLKDMENAPKRAEALKARVAELEGQLSNIRGDNGATPSALDELRGSVGLILGNGRLADIVVNTVFRETGSIGKTVNLFDNLLSGSIFSGFGANSIGSMLGSLGSLTNPELMSASLELVQLKVQESMLGLQQGTSLESIYKALSDSAEKAYAQAEEIVFHLKNGWIAEYDGIIRDVNVVQNEEYNPENINPMASSISVTSLLASLSAGQADIGSLLGGLFSGTVNGMKVEYYPFTASFMLGKYDIAKVSLDQQVKVTSVTGKEFDAVVTYISPVASETSALDLGSMLGGGGSSRGVEARITIPQPDESITIGLDVDVSIDLETRHNVLQVPAETILYDEDIDQNYVFVFNRPYRTINKQYVTIGLFDGAVYEITEGLRTGQEVVRAPDRAWQSGQRIRISG